MKPLRIWLLFFAAFVAGVLAGATVMRAFDHPKVRQALLHGSDQRQDFLLARLARELKLTPAQHVRMQAIMSETREQLMRLRLRIQPEAQKITTEGRQRMEQGLTKEQIARFREIMNRQPSRGHDHPPGQGPRSPRPDRDGSNAVYRATETNQP